MSESASSQQAPVATALLSKLTKIIGLALDSLARHISEQKDVTDGVPLRPDEPICVHVSQAYNFLDQAMAAIMLTANKAVATTGGTDITLVEVSVDTCFDDALDRRALAEGWGLFHVHSRGYEIERIDCPEGSCEDGDGGAPCTPPHLDSDAVAIDLCLRKALGGSAMHLLALMMEQMPAGRKLYLPQWFLDQAKDL